MKIRSLDDLMFLATELEGKCLSAEFTDQMSDHAWQCKKGHTFDISPFLVSKGAWCPQCVKRKTPEEHFQWFQNYALERGGKCLSDKFTDRKTRMTFECAQGHQWEVLPTTLIYDQTWCKKCVGLAPLSLDDMKMWAIERGGECLSKRYKGRDSKLHWKCAAGHQFEHSPRMIQRGCWCTKCTRNKGITESIEVMKIWAAERGGKCLSTNYVNTESRLEWECKKGHQFKKSRDQVKQLTATDWCPKCNRTKREGKIEVKRLDEIRRHATEKGGKCLSETYLNLETTLKFICSKGHVWETKAHNVIYSRSWCPECNMERLRKGVMRKK